MSALAICLGLFAAIGLTCGQMHMPMGSQGMWGRQGLWGNTMGHGQGQGSSDDATRATCRNTITGKGTIEVDIRRVSSSSMWGSRGSLQMDVTVNGHPATAGDYKVVLTEFGSVGNSGGCDNDNLGRILQGNNRGNQGGWGGHQGWGSRGWGSRQGWGSHHRMGWGSMDMMDTMDMDGVIGEITLDASGDGDEMFTELTIDNISEAFGAGFALCKDTEEVPSSSSSMSHWGWGRPSQTRFRCEEPIDFCCTLARSDTAPN